MRKLDQKLVRDLRRTWAQAVAIALVLAAGIATLVLANGAYRSLFETRAAYYERYRFADIFATARRVPLEVARRIAELPGIQATEPRVQATALLDIEGFAQPATGLILSLPKHGGQPRVNALYLRAGRLPESLRDDEAVINETFAKAHKLSPGGTLKAILNGRKRTLRIVGIAMSPEFVYALGPGDIVPDDKRFGVIWLSENAAQAAFDLKGAFNSISVKMMRGFNHDATLAEIDRLLQRYGGRGGVLRKDQQSHAFIDAELVQLKAMSRVVPPMFLLVAAFLINMTLARLVAMEREQIGLLKALGYDDITVAAHYLKYVSAIALGGIIVGLGAGVWLGRGLTHIYAEFYHFPFLVFSNPPDVFLTAAAIGLVASWIGSLQALRRVMMLSPAVAMAPPVPPRYSRGVLERLGVAGRISQLTMMILRHLIRYPVRSLMTTMGIAASCALMVMSLSSTDAIEKMIDITYFQSSRQHITIGFENLKPQRAVLDVARLPGVLKAEPVRIIAATLRHGHRSRRISIQALSRNSDLQRLLDLNLAPFALPEAGLVLSEKLARILDVTVGDIIEVETTDHRRRLLRLPVSALQQGYLGLSVFADLDTMNTLLGDGHAISSAHMSIDTTQEAALYAKLKSLPSISSIMMLRASLSTFRDTLARNIHIMMSVYVILSVVITFGVVYNSARIQLSERARELASLRVLGFTATEVSYILLGQIALTVAVAIPLGWIGGYWFTALLMQSFETELYRVPLIVERSTYGLAAVIVLATALVSALIVRRRVDAFNLVSVLKSRE